MEKTPPPPTSHAARTRTHTTTHDTRHMIQTTETQQRQDVTSTDEKHSTKQGFKHGVCVGEHYHDRTGSSVVGKARPANAKKWASLSERVPMWIKSFATFPSTTPRKSNVSLVLFLPRILVSATASSICLISARSMTCTDAYRTSCKMPNIFGCSTESSNLCVLLLSSPRITRLSFRFCCLKGLS